jgi:hypothetical protein
LPACIITYLPAVHDKSRGPLLRPSCVVSALRGYMASSDFSVRVSLHFALQLIADLTIGVGYRPTEISLVFCISLMTFRSPYTVEFFKGAFQILPLPWPSPVSEWFGSPCSVCRRCRIPFMERIVILHLFLRGILQPVFTPPVAQGMRSLLRGSLAITATGLSPVSCHRLHDTPLTLRHARSPSPKATLSIEGFSSFVTSTTASIATGWSEPVPGWDFHPLKSSAFSRRTLSIPIRPKCCCSA